MEAITKNEAIKTLLDMVVNDYMGIFDNDVINEQADESGDPLFWPKMVVGCKALCDANDFPAPDWLNHEVKCLEGKVDIN